MFLLLVGLLMPILLVFGLYHLLTWYNVAGINRRPLWQRVGMAAAISHILLVAGFFAFSYFDYNANRNTTLAGFGFDGYLFNRSEFWRLMTIFDTAPMLVLLMIAAVLDRVGLNAPLVLVAAGVTLVVGTVQWYFLGGLAGVLLSRFWSGLKTGDDDWL